MIQLVGYHIWDAADMRDSDTITPNYAATYRKRLLDAFVIRETERGEVDFAVPFLREYLRRNQ